MIGTLLAIAVICAVAVVLGREYMRALDSDDDAESLRRHEAAREALRRRPPL